jgi:hypothetical protein
MGEAIVLIRMVISDGPFSDMVCDRSTRQKRRNRGGFAVQELDQIKNPYERGRAFDYRSNTMPFAGSS